MCEEQISVKPSSGGLSKQELECLLDVTIGQMKIHYKRLQIALNVVPEKTEAFVSNPMGEMFDRMIADFEAFKRSEIREDSLRALHSMSKNASLYLSACKSAIENLKGDLNASSLNGATSIDDSLTKLIDSFNNCNIGRNNEAAVHVSGKQGMASMKHKRFSSLKKAEKSSF